MGKSYWLLKTEPTTYSFDQLVQERRTHWNGVRNFQARKFLTQIQSGDLAIIYHSGEERSAVGIAKVVRESYPDPDPKKPGDWVQIDIEAVNSLQSPVTLTEIKNTPALKDILLIKQSRLSVMPISESQYATLIKLSEKRHPDSSILSGLSGSPGPRRRKK